VAEAAERLVLDHKTLGFSHKWLCPLAGNQTQGIFSLRS
jgi:hypothetical protein